MFLLLALASSLVYGSADFLGGLATRRSPVLPVVALSQAAGLAVLLVAMPFLPSHATHADLAWGAAAGLTGGVGVSLLYHALAIGPMSVVAPVTAVCSISVPVVVGLALGERPGVRALAGVVLAAAAIVLISREPTPHDATSPAARISRGVWVALVAGVVIGFFYVCLSRTGPTAGLWPLLTARGVSVTLFAGAALVGGRSLLPVRAALPAVLGSGVLDMIANVLYLLAVRGGLLSIVSTLASLYPAATVVLAAIVLRERLRAQQLAGLACAAVAVVLITMAV
jgi:drug/metabolite transporter (DMT)-like permease